MRSVARVLLLFGVGARAHSTKIALGSTDMEETITLAGGCFWCIEGAFSAMRGVKSAESGYIDGHVKNPTYKQVCGGDTGHAEAVRIVFNPEVLGLHKLLKIFFTIHDPTTLNRQGNDVGTQYRSGVYYENDTQRGAVEQYIAEIQPKYSSRVVTEVKPASTWYPAEDYHQHYYEKNPDAGYCQAVVRGKVMKAKAAEQLA